MKDILPSSLPRQVKTVPGPRFGLWVPIYCANCGADGGKVPADGPKFAFYLCEKCAEKWSPLAGAMLTPDEAYWQMVAADSAKGE